MGSVPVQFQEDRCKGEAVMCMKSFNLTMRLQMDGQTDRRTDGRTWCFQYTPLLRCGGVKMEYRDLLQV